METVKARFSWSGPGDDRLWLLVDPPYPSWDGEPEAYDWSWYLMRGVDGDDRDTRAITGLEVLDFLEFDRWHTLPKLPFLWQLDGWEPLPLDEMLRRKQRAIREELATAAAKKGGSASATPDIA